MKFTCIYADDQGETHFGFHEMPRHDAALGPPPTPIGRMTNRIPVSSLVTYSAPAGTGATWHNASQPHVCIVLSGEGEGEGARHVIQEAGSMQGVEEAPWRSTSSAGESGPGTGRPHCAEFPVAGRMEGSIPVPSLRRSSATCRTTGGSRLPNVCKEDPWPRRVHVPSNGFMFLPM